MLGVASALLDVPSGARPAAARDPAPDAAGEPVPAPALVALTPAAGGAAAATPRAVAGIPVAAAGAEAAESSAVPAAGPPG